MKRSITIDPGHGGHDSGAVGPTGLKEKDVVLIVSKLLAGMLTQAGVVVHLTRGDDRFLTLADRADLANAANTGLFLSIHCNSGPTNSGDGFEVFTTPGQTAADPFATDLFLEYARKFPGKRKRIDDRDGDPDKEANFAVIRLAKMPAALFELEFIHTRPGAAFLSSGVNHVAMAEALCDGVLRHLGIVKPLPAAPVTKPTLKERARRISTELANLAEEL